MQRLIYIDVVISRNSAVMRYNDSVELWTKKQTDIAYYKAKLDSLAEKTLTLKAFDPTLPAVTAYMQTTYIESVSMVLETLYLTQRAYQFLTLDVYDAIGSALKDNPLSSVSYKDCVNVRSKILIGLSKAKEEAGRYAQPFDDVTFRVPEIAVESLRQSNSCTFVIPPSNRHTRKAGSPFFGKSNIRLSKVRFYLEGVQKLSANPPDLLSAIGEDVQVSITHTGEEQIYSPKNIRHSFVHAPISQQFKYQIGGTVGATVVPQKIITDGDIGTRPEGDFALVGPLTAWKVEVREQLNEQLSFKNVTGAWMEFEGWFHEFE